MNRPVGDIMILAVDPGLASGIALVRWSRDPHDLPVVAYSVEAQPEEFASEIRYIQRLTAGVVDFGVACERFTITQKTASNTQAPWSLEQIGVLKHLCRENGYDPKNILFQAPANAKAMFPNPALKRLGTWHRGGEGHALDAIRHGLLALVKTGWAPTALLEE